MYALNINVFNTFGTISSTPYLLTTFMVISDETRNTLQYAFLQATVDFLSV